VGEGGDGGRVKPPSGAAVDQHPGLMHLNKHLSHTVDHLDASINKAMGLTKSLKGLGRDGGEDLYGSIQTAGGKMFNILANNFTTEAPLSLRRGGSSTSMDAKGSAGVTARSFKASAMLKSPNAPIAQSGVLDVIEFNSVEYICTEDDRIVNLDIVRRGVTTGRVEVEYNVSEVLGAKAVLGKGKGKKSVVSAGTAALNPGESSTTIQIKVPTGLFRIMIYYFASNAVFLFCLALGLLIFWQVENDPLFNVERLQEVSLHFTDANQTGAVLGDLAVCRIVILNNDLFPGDVDLKKPLPVIKAFIMHNYKLLPKETHWGLFFKLSPALRFIVNQNVTQYTVKTITIAFAVQSRSDGEVPQTYINALWFLGMCYFANFLAGYFFDKKFAKLKLGGKARSGLRVLCMDTATQLTPKGEEKFDTGRILKIVDSAVDKSVEASWMACFTVWRLT